MGDNQVTESIGPEPPAPTPDAGSAGDVRAAVLDELTTWVMDLVAAHVASAVAADRERVAAAEHERDQAVAVADSMQHFADVAEVCERKSNEYAARAARVEALADEWRAVRDGVLSPGLRRAADALSLTLSGLTDEPDLEAGARATEALARLHRAALAAQSATAQTKASTTASPTGCTTAAARSSQPSPASTTRPKPPPRRPPRDPHTNNDRVCPPVCPQCVPERPQGTQRSECVPVPPIFDRGHTRGALSTVSLTCRKTTGHTHHPGRSLMAFPDNLGGRTLPAYHAIRELLADDSHHPHSELVEAATTASDLTPKSVDKLIRTGWRAHHWSRSLPRGVRRVEQAWYRKATT